MNMRFYTALLLAWLIHEATHIITAKILGVPAKITFEKFKLCYIKLPLDLKPQEEFLIAISAPIINFLLMMWSSNRLLDEFSSANMLLALGNLIPILPLDAGRAVRIILTNFISYEKATKILTTLGKSLALAFMMIIYYYQLKHFLYIGAIWLYHISQTEEKNASLKSNYKIMQKIIKTTT